MGKELTGTPDGPLKVHTSALDSSDDEDDVPLVNLKKVKKPSDKPSKKTPVTKSRPARKVSANMDKYTSSRRSQTPAVLDTSDDDDEDDVPLVHLLKKSKHEKPFKKRAVLDSSDDDEDEDDVPLLNLLKKLQGDKPSEKAADDSSDDEPLTKYTKPRPVKKTEENQKKSNSNLRTKRKTEAVEEDTSSSDDKPLSEVCKRLLSRQQNPAKSRRKPKAVRKRTVSSSDDSDDEPLVKRSQKSKDTKPQPLRHKPKETVSSDGSSEDDLPLVNLTRKRDQKTTKTKTTLAKRSAPKPTARVKKSQAVAAESSDDEPRIKLLKRPLKDATNTRPLQWKDAMSAKTERGKTPEEGRFPAGFITSHWSSSDSSDDEPLIKMAKNPHLTKYLKVMVERCSVGGLGEARKKAQ